MTVTVTVGSVEDSGYWNSSFSEHSALTTSPPVPYTQSSDAIISTNNRLNKRTHHDAAPHGPSYRRRPIILQAFWGCTEYKQVMSANPCFRTQIIKRSCLLHPYQSLQSRDKGTHCDTGQQDLLLLRTTYHESDGDFRSPTKGKQLPRGSPASEFGAEKKDGNNLSMCDELYILF